MSRKASCNHIQVPKKGAKSVPSVVDVSTPVLSVSKHESSARKVLVNIGSSHFQKRPREHHSTEGK